MKLTFLGGADEVGASATLVEIAGKKILVDAGIRISPKSSRGLQHEQLPHLAYLSDIGGPDVILVTHAHTDHTGALPQVIRAYPRVPVYATEATVELSRVLLLDSTRLMENRLEAEGELPLYDAADVEQLLSNWQTFAFGKALTLSADLQVTPYVSGHIAGAAMLVFESTEGVLVMSGDVSVSPQRTVESARPPRIRADALVLESTYGGREHADRKFEEQRLIDTLKAIIEDGGKVLIPAFALGRAQEVIQILLAYHDQIDVPVYVDGMIRAVCDAYGKFTDILPPATVKRAGQQPLFFRDNVHPVRDRAMREELMHRAEPAIVIASSGMLTGGASVAYASTFAAEERNAIFLTGYQDAESPGRFIQNMMKRKAHGDTPYLQLGKERVPLRCQLGKYALSAHAAESELVGIVEAVDADRVFLVHGDNDARHSLWETLRSKGRDVSRPKVGQEKHIAKRRQLVIKRDGEIGELEPATNPLDPEALWNQLNTHQGETFTAREIAQIWYGDVERAQEVIELLEDDTTYFSQHWRNKGEITVKTRAQVEKVQRSREIMLEHPDLDGQLIVMRNANGDPRLAVVDSANYDGFSATMQGSSAKNHPGNALLWALGDWTGDADENIKIQLNEILAEAEQAMERVMPFSTRRLLATEGEIIDLDAYVTPPQVSVFGDPDDDELVEWQRYQTELAAVVLSLARDGAFREGNGLKIERALPSGPVNQQIAREAALKAFPATARLRKVGMIAAKQTLILNFDFPEVARREYDEAIRALTTETGWEASVKMTTNQQALSEVVRDVLPDGASVVKGPSLFMDRKEITVEVEGLSDDQRVDAEEAYEELTGFRLRVVVRGSDTGDTAPTVAGEAQTAPAAMDGIQMEINAAYAMVRQRLEPLGLQKVGLKQGEMVLTFISPQVGERYPEVIAALAHETGYPMRLHPNPMQNLILERAKALVRDAGWDVRKGPGIHTDRGEVSVKLDSMVNDDAVAVVSGELEQLTGYRLVVR